MQNREIQGECRAHVVLLPFTCSTVMQGCVTLTQRWDMPGGLLVGEGNTTPHMASAMGSSLGTKRGPTKAVVASK